MFLRSIITPELPTALVAMLGDAVLDEEGAVVLVVVDEVVGADVTCTVRGFSADEGKKGMAGLVAFGVIEFDPVPKSKHVTLMTPANKVYNSRLPVNFV